MKIAGMKDSRQPQQLAGKNAIITGAAVGLGQAYAKALGAAGVNLALCDTRDSIAAAHKQDLAPVTYAEVLDVSQPRAVHEFVNHAVDKLGGIDILINNAGRWRASTPSDDFSKTADDYDTVVGTNLTGVLLMGRAVIPHMIAQQRGGEIVNISTDHSVTCATPWSRCPRLPTCPWAAAPRPTGGGDGMDLYDAAKWGLNGLLYAWAKALAPEGIRVNQFCMGATDSHMLRSFHKFAPSAEEQASWMRPADSAAALLELLSEGPTGRNAQSINFCVGRPVRLEEPLTPIYVEPEAIRVVPAT